ncbi:MAG: DUF86 domain-containing protein [Pseudobutyrivibrio sp.]|nr:DUF86 domain-containing protein [Pseudobutyrivibrio sp.]
MIEADKQRLIKILSNWDNLQQEFEKRGITKEDVLNDSFVQWAVTTPLYNIGEHVNNLSKDFVVQYPQIPWSKIAGLRHRLVYNYDGTNWNIIVEVIYEDFPAFIS